MSRDFPQWLDPRSLQWAADYCEAMAIRLANHRPTTTGYVAADVCAKGLRNAGELVRERVPPLLLLMEP